MSPRTGTKTDSGPSGPQRIGFDDTEELIEQAQNLARETQELKANQIRRLYGPVVKLRMRTRGSGKVDFEGDIQSELLLLKPKLVYTAGRKDEAEPLAKMLETLIDRVDSLPAFESFCDFFEAYVAYHKQYE